MAIILNLEDMTVIETAEESNNVFVVEMTVTEARTMFSELDAEAHEDLTDKLDKAQAEVFTDNEIATYLVIKITK